MDSGVALPDSIPGSKGHPSERDPLRSGLAQNLDGEVWIDRAVLRIVHRVAGSAGEIDKGCEANDRRGFFALNDLAAEPGPSRRNFTAFPGLAGNKVDGTDKGRNFAEARAHLELGHDCRRGADLGIELWERLEFGDRVVVANTQPRCPGDQGVLVVQVCLDGLNSTPAPNDPGLDTKGREGHAAKHVDRDAGEPHRRGRFDPFEGSGEEGGNRASMLVVRIPGATGIGGAQDISAAFVIGDSKEVVVGSGIFHGGENVGRSGNLG